MNDTSEEIAKIQREIIFSKTPSERFLMGIEMYEMARKTVENSIKKQNPHISEKNLKIEVFKRFYKNDFSNEEMEKIVAHF